MEHFYGLTIGILSVWRISYLLHAEDGPWDLFGRLRRLASAGFWSSLFSCFYCVSVWVAAPFALLLEHEWKERLLLWPALSGGAILLERLSGRSAPAPVAAAYYEEDEEEVKPDVRMRKNDYTAERFPSAGESGRISPRNN